MPYLTQDGFVSDIVRATRAIQVFAIRMDTLNTQNIQYRPNDQNIGGVFNYLKTQTTVTFPNTGIIEGWWWEPGSETLQVQVYDPSFSTVALNDTPPVNVL